MSDAAPDEGSEALSALLHETRQFPPPEEFTRQANAQPGIYEEAAADSEAWWATQAEQLTWDRHWDKVLEWDLPFAKWFVGGRLNAAYNCVDRHVEAGRGDKVAFHWVGEPEGDPHHHLLPTCRGWCARLPTGSSSWASRPGDRVAIYMPMIPETVVAMLACARLGAPHSVIFGGFSSEALSGRILDCDCRVVITADGGYRRGALQP
jgi:acetyl-CoA synthetase